VKIGDTAACYRPHRVFEQDAGTDGGASRADDQRDGAAQIRPADAVDASERAQQAIAPRFSVRRGNADDRLSRHDEYDAKISKRRHSAPGDLTDAPSCCRDGGGLDPGDESNPLVHMIPF
jgi:hypothetical protein